MPSPPPSRRRRGAALILAAAAGALGPSSCSRTELAYGPPLILPDCVADSDCPGWGDLCNAPITCDHVPEDGGFAARCVHHPSVDCDDDDPCTKDTCNPDTGKCAYAHATPDQDGDGHFAPLPGFTAGSTGACGDDCDDTNPKVYPNAAELCDGVDNDCDGIVDNGAVYLPKTAADVRVSGPVAPAEPGGFAYDGQSYVAAYSGQGTDNERGVFVSTLTPTGKVITPPGEQPFTLVNAAASGGPVEWIGDRYGIAWEDRRDGDYEIYFNTLGSDGAKQRADVRLTFAAGFSVNPSLTWDGTEFLVAWQDDRNGSFDVFAERVDASGAPLGAEIQLTQGDAMFDNESPVLAVGHQGVGMTWAFGNSLHHWVDFQVWSPDLTTPITPPLQVTDGTTDAEYPTVVWNRDRYVVAWFDQSASPKAIYAAAYLADGTQIIAPRPITHPGSFRSRYPFLKPLGDRLLVVYADDRDQNQGYEIYTTTVKADLTPLGSELRVTNAPRDSIFPLAAFGHEGDFGVLFRDDREAGEENIYFTTLTCFMP